MEDGWSGWPRDDRRAQGHRMKGRAAGDGRTKWADGGMDVSKGGTMAKEITAKKENRNKTMALDCRLSLSLSTPGSKVKQVAPTN